MGHFSRTDENIWPERASFHATVLPVDWEGTGLRTMTPLGLPFGAAITLECYATQVDPGALKVTLRWSTEAYADTGYSVFPHLASSGGGAEVVA